MKRVPDADVVVIPAGQRGLVAASRLVLPCPHRLEEPRAVPDDIGYVQLVPVVVCIRPRVTRAPKGECGHAPSPTHLLKTWIEADLGSPVSTRAPSLRTSTTRPTTNMPSRSGMLALERRKISLSSSVSLSGSGIDSSARSSSLWITSRSLLFLAKMNMMQQMRGWKRPFKKRVEMNEAQAQIRSPLVDQSGCGYPFSTRTIGAHSFGISTTAEDKNRESTDEEEEANGPVRVLARFARPCNRLMMSRRASANLMQSARALRTESGVHVLHVLAQHVLLRN